MEALLLAPILAISSYTVARLVAYPLVWLKLRRTTIWRERPKDVSSFELLLDFIFVPVFLCVVFGFLVGLAVWVGTGYA